MVYPGMGSRDQRKLRLRPRILYTPFRQVLINFFFKQKTAYDIGLGIPAEPLSDLFSASCATSAENVANTSSSPHAAAALAVRSEERRVGKESRSRGSPYH